MGFDKLNERWKSLVLWYHGMEKSSQLKLESLADSGYSFLVLSAVAVFILWLAIT